MVVASAAAVKLQMTRIAYVDRYKVIGRLPADSGIKRRISIKITASAIRTEPKSIRMEQPCL